ncbi:UNVERIFIED_CONTAM: Retrovirus-related Pol polyprotein from transposon RE1 [Sesamum indicum]
MADLRGGTVESTPADMRSGGEQNHAKLLHLEYSPLPIISAPLNGNNWLAWSRAIRIALGGRDKLSFIDGTCVQPREGTEEMRQWRTTDYMVLTWILNTISKEIVNAYLYTSSARALWLELEARYGESNGPLLYQIQREINSMTQGNMSVATYYTKLKQLWDEIRCLIPTTSCTCGLCMCGSNDRNIVQTEAGHLIQFLMGLNDSFDGVRSQILVMEPLPHVDKAYSMVMRVERQRQIHLESMDTGVNTAMYVRNVEHDRSYVYKTFGKKKVTDKRHLTCESCGKMGHDKDTCFKIHGIPEWYRELSDKRKKGSNEGKAYVAIEKAAGMKNTSLISDFIEALKLVQNKAASDPVKVHYAQFDEAAGMASNTTSNKHVSGSWIIDTGATRHMCGDATLLDSLAPIHPTPIISLPDGNTTDATHTGTVKLSHNIILEHVLHIPSFQHNLLSVSQLCQALPIRFSFSNNLCLLQDRRTEKVLAIGKQIGKLYYLDTLSFSPMNKASYSNSVSESLLLSHVHDAYELWHKRLGHPSANVLSHISSLNLNKSIEPPVCHVCPLAKQARTPFPSSTSTSSILFELVHVDIWGPYKQPSIGGCHYVLTLVDDYSRATWTYLMRYKSQTTSLLSSFIKQVQTQFGLQVRSLRTDNGPEFLASSCQELIKNHGIIHQKSCVYTPQQNGVVERKHKHLLQVARALMFESHLPKHFWAESILAATFIINRLPSPTLNWKSPYELLYKTSPSYQPLKTFGCLCYAANVQPHKSKFEPRATRCVFIGYVHGQKAYKLYDIEQRSVLISRDVIFHENVFPYKNCTIESEHCPVPLPINVDCEPINSAPLSTAISSTTSENLSTSFPSSASDNSTADTHPSLAVSPPSLPRRSTRPSHKPSWLKDFVCHSYIDCQTPSFSVASSHLSFLAALSIVQEPRTYAQAKDILEWQQAMDAEITALEENDTWEVTTLPSDKRAIGCKWVYKVKLKPDGSVDKYKARLVAKGYNQIEGIDYLESFSPVAKAVTVRLFLAIASSFGWALHQIDINNAFLHGYLNEDIYMLPPDGYSVPQGQVCKLKRSLYGLKQASRQWNHEFTTKLLAYGFVQSHNDHCLFSKSIESEVIFLLVYVDDVLISSSAEALIQPVKDYLHGLFTIKDLGHAKYFLGLEIARSSEGTSVTQQKYIKDIIHDSGLDNANPVHTPLPLGLKLSSCGTVLEDPESYRRLIGRLLYLGFTRPDVSYGAQQLSQFVHRPCKEHLAAALHLVKYLKGTSTKGLFFPAHNSFSLTGYCDADWASCPDSRRSLTGYCIFLGSALISWKTKKQPTVSRSTAEAEYRSLAATVCELQWISYLLKDFQVPIQTPIPLYCDNQAAVHIVANPVFHERTKHLEIDCHLVRDKYKDGFVLPSHVPSKLQLADCFTKVLARPALTVHLSKLGLVDFSSSPT